MHQWGGTSGSVNVGGMVALAAMGMGGGASATAAATPGGGSIGGASAYGGSTSGLSTTSYGSMVRAPDNIDPATIAMLSVVQEDGSVQPLTQEPSTLDPFLNRKTVFRGHTDAIKSMVVDSQNSRLYAASWDETVGVWNIPTRQLIGVLPHGCWVNAVTLAFGKGVTRLVVTGSEDGKVSFWSTNDLLILYQVQPTHGPITHLCFYRDTVFAASGATVYAISAATGTVVREYKESKSMGSGFSTVPEVTSLVAHDDQVYVGLEDGRVVAREIVGGFVLRELFAHNKPSLGQSSVKERVASVRSLLINAATNTLYTGGDDGIIKAWTISTGALTRSMNLHRHGVYTMALHMRDGDHYLYSGSSDGTIKVTRLSHMQTSTLVPFAPYCMVIVGGAESSHNQLGGGRPAHHLNNSKGRFGSIGGGGGEDLLTQSMSLASPDLNGHLSLRPVVREAILLAGDFSGTIELIEVEKFEENLKGLPSNNVVVGGGGVPPQKPTDVNARRGIAK